MSPTSILLHPDLAPPEIEHVVDKCGATPPCIRIRYEQALPAPLLIVLQIRAGGYDRARLTTADHCLPTDPNSIVSLRVDDGMAAYGRSWYSNKARTQACRSAHEFALHILACRVFHAPRS